jgi:xanthine dehydrogenase accessory factor
MQPLGKPFEGFLKRRFYRLSVCDDSPMFWSPNTPADLPTVPGCWVEIERFEGSSPREVGAWMWVTADAVQGTVGGGHLEFDAIAHAREGLAWGRTADTKRYALGPSLGQCCGGVVWVRFEWVHDPNAPENIARKARWTPAIAGFSSKSMPVALFGGGHVGRAIVALLGALPVRVQWFDSRDEIFPLALPANVRAEHSDPVEAAVADIEPGARVLIMSFSHAEDLEVLAACLKRQRERADLPYIGLIGSKTKWATFRHRLEARGFAAEELAHVTSPIGVAGVVGKEPSTIAVAVAAQLLQTRTVQPLTPTPSRLRESEAGEP